ncbi:hypothetical protein [Winogradskyella immobilis]|nr:hypothetical protein [Winogradskyella immobilis]
MFNYSIEYFKAKVRNPNRKRTEIKSLPIEKDKMLVRVNTGSNRY